MTTITITLPEDLAKRAKAKGLLSPTAIESYVRDRLQEADDGEQNSILFDDIKFDPNLEGLVNPAAFRRGTINGDIVGPFHEAWGDPK